MPVDGTCTSWWDGPDELWLDCCYPQHDCDCEEVYPLPCPIESNYALMECVTASSYSSKAEYPDLIRVNAKLMFVGVTVLNPLTRFLSRLAHGEALDLKDII